MSGFDPKRKLAPVATAANPTEIYAGQASVNPYKVTSLVMGLAFSAFVVSRLWQALRDGRIAYWRSVTRMLYAERAKSPALFWTAVAYHAAVLGFALWWFCVSPWQKHVVSGQPFLPPSGWIFLLSGAAAFAYLLLVFAIVWRFNRIGADQRGQTDDLDIWSVRPSDSVKVFLYVVAGRPLDPALRWMTGTARLCLVSTPVFYLLGIGVAFIPAIVAANSR